MKITSMPDSDLRSSSDGLFLQIATGGKSSIFVRKTLQVRLRDHKSVSFCKLGGQDLRFSMKMMSAPDLGSRDSPSERLNSAHLPD